MPCNKDPRAPHGFDRTASLTRDRYVCECEGWIAPQDVWTYDGGKLEAALADARRELAAYKQAVSEGIAANWNAQDIGHRIAELLAANT